MRSDLAPLRGKRARFSATFAGISPRGYIILSDVLGPVGEFHHIWVPREEWQTYPPRPGKRIELVATVDHYQRGRDNSEDHGLANCREVLP